MDIGIALVVVSLFWVIIGVIALLTTRELAYARGYSDGYSDSTVDTAKALGIEIHDDNSDVETD